jgi:hypothetical protein
MKQINASYNLDRRLKCINKKTLPFLEKQFIGKFTPISEKLKGYIVPKTGSNMPWDLSYTTRYVSNSPVSCRIMISDFSPNKYPRTAQAVADLIITRAP